MEQIFDLSFYEEQEKKDIAALRAAQAEAGPGWYRAGALALEEFTFEDTVNQSIMDAVSSFTHSEIVKMLYMEADEAFVITEEYLVKAGVKPVPALYGKTLKQTRRALHRMVGTFRPDSGDGETQRLRGGAYELNKEKEPIERLPRLDVGFTKVKVEEVPLARLMSTCTRNKATTKLADPTEERSDLVQEMRASVANFVTIPITMPYSALAWNLRVADSKGVIGWVWKLIEAKVAAGSFPTTGLDHLYWSYRGEAYPFKPIDQRPPPPPSFFFEKFKDFPTELNSMTGFTKKSVWIDGAPASGPQIAATVLHGIPVRSMTGPFPGALAAWVTNIHLHGLSFSHPDPNADVQTTFVNSKQFGNLEVDLLWAPTKHVASVTESLAIAIPVSTETQVLEIASAFLRMGKRYQFIASIGPHPLIWVVVNKDGYVANQGLDILSRLVAAVKWLPFYNLSGTFIPGYKDIFMVSALPDGIEFVRTERLKRYCHVQMQGVNKISPLEDAWAAPELNFTKDTLTFNFFPPSEEEMVVDEQGGPPPPVPGSPAYTPAPPPAGPVLDKFKPAANGNARKKKKTEVEALR